MQPKLVVGYVLLTFSLKPKKSRYRRGCRSTKVKAANVHDFDVLIAIGPFPWGFPCDDAVLKRAVISEKRNWECVGEKIGGRGYG
jgi:hypothetical protein